ncbi:response regulator [uncultured Pseudokineococcus sp.]|uniref:response regulator n=1 Tax=uncultured Pseudokineococcus sp. TaxID=1642928 RepID=UPI00262E0B2B|nr:response regulator [uncultured Pseudokineococcus sp.]
MIALVVDDSRAMRRIVSGVLRRAGMDVLEAGDGQKALDVLERHLAAGGDVPDIACIDWNMPVMDGLQLVTTVRRRRELRSMALMMVTSESEQSQVVKALAAGAHEYLFKPFTPEALLAKLELLGLAPAPVGEPATAGGASWS